MRVRRRRRVVLRARPGARGPVRSRRRDGNAVDAVESAVGQDVADDVSHAHRREVGAAVLALLHLLRRAGARPSAAGARRRTGACARRLARGARRRRPAGRDAQPAPRAGAAAPRQTRARGRLPTRRAWGGRGGNRRRGARRHRSGPRGGWGEPAKPPARRRAPDAGRAYSLARRGAGARRSRDARGLGARSDLAGSRACARGAASGEGARGRRTTRRRARRTAALAMSISFRARRGTRAPRTNDAARPPPRVAAAGSRPGCLAPGCLGLRESARPGSRSRRARRGGNVAATRGEARGEGGTAVRSRVARCGVVTRRAVQTRLVRADSR